MAPPISPVMRSCRSPRRAKPSSSPLRSTGKTDIRREDRGIKETRLGKVVNGVLTLSVRALQTMDYEITSPPDEDREVVIEEVRGDGWKPVAESKDVEETASRLRYKV